MMKKSPSDTRLIIILATLVLLLRIIFIDIYQSLQDSFGLSLFYFVRLIVENYVVCVVLLILNITFIIQLNKYVTYGQSPLKRLLWLVTYILVITLVTTIVINADMLMKREFVSGEIFLSLLASLLINSTIVVVADLVFYYRQTHIRLIAEGNKKRKAQYQYLQLKQQLNPHFLFNSLNILDYIVQNDEKERASTFIHKLAGIYRYLLNKENEQTVTLEQELQFVAMYVDLLKERFADGLNIQTNIAVEYWHYRIVPCALQIMVENAIKHNIVSPEKPLTITIGIINDMLTVTNNLQPKLTPVQSTGVGLSNIAQQYQDISGKDIDIDKKATEFTVKIPLLNPNSPTTL